MYVFNSIASVVKLHCWLLQVEIEYVSVSSFRGTVNYVSAVGFSEKTIGERNLHYLGSSRKLCL